MSCGVPLPLRWLWIGMALAGSLVLAALAYWQLIIAEGAYLGPRVVAWTYDWVARRYDAIKQFNPREETWFLSSPLLRALAEVSNPLVLDVATGTGRLPLALLRSHFRGQIVGLDLSAGMLKQARSQLRIFGDQVGLVQQDACHLPFDDGVFDAVTCLEALEFLPRPRKALAEMVRVLAPGGVLFLSNRVGREAHLLPGRSLPRPVFEQMLASSPLRDAQVRAWQVDYDLAMARKEGQPDSAGRGGIDLASLLRCPGCGGRLQGTAIALNCHGCERRYAVREGIVRLAAPTG